MTPTALEPLHDENDRQRRTVLSFWWVGALPWPLVFALVYGLVLHCAMGAMICALTSLAMLPIPWFARRATGVHFAANWLIAVMIGALTALGCVTGGSGSPALTWLIAAPLIAIHVAGFRAGIAWCATSLAILITFDVLKHVGVHVQQQLSQREFDLLATLGNSGAVLMVTTLAIAYDAQRLAAVKLARTRQENLRSALERAEEQAREIEHGSEALRQSEALHRSLVHNSPMGMYFYELDDHDQLILTGANPAADRLTGVDSRALLGLPLESAFSGLRETEVPARYRAAAADGIPWSVDRFSYADSSLSGVFEFRAFQTAPRKMVTVFMNITDRVRAEAAVRSSEREIALQAGKAEVATHVLHNVGNVLSRVKVSATLLREAVMKSEAPTVGLVAGLLAEHEQQLSTFLENDDRGKALPAFLRGLADVLVTEQSSIVAELRCMSDAIEHIARVIGMQQVHSKGGALLESVRPAELVDQALSISVSGRLAEAIEIARDFDVTEPVTLERHKVLQILVNLFSNAAHAVSGVQRPRITCRVERLPAPSSDGIRFSVADNGIGIAAEQLPRIFTFGFTTRQDGHGFGLHSCANLAQEMDGELRVASEGAGRGATFVLDLPRIGERVRS
ncbi:MAG: ATP-binding protein [Phycisphaerae bacterium]